jgi:chromosome segregation protein
MRVKGLRIDGFKSFVDAVTIPIAPGMTGIVGPNGCGKSNLLEAMRWAMGETSAKRIRGTEMDDVIFSGTERRQPRNVCEVGIILDNDRHDAPEQFNDAEEIEIVRRIERGEGSAYRINSKMARASDVRLVFRDIGTGSGSAAMISQGRVGAVINSRPTERRGILEEAAGVSGLEPRRREAELRLQATELNLVRAEDTATSLAEMIDRLKKEARQAQRWRELDGFIKQAEALMLLARMAAADQRLAQAMHDQESCERKLAEAVEVAANAGQQRDRATGILVPLRESRIAHETQVARLDAKREQTQAEADRAQENLEDARRRTAEARADLERETALVEEARSRLEEFAVERRAVFEAQATESDALEQASERAETLQVRVERLDREVEALLSTSAASDAVRSEASRRVNEFGLRVRQTAGRLAELKSRLEALRTSAQGAELAEAEEILVAAEAAAESARARLVETEREALSARDIELETKSRLGEANGALAALVAEMRGLDAQLGESDPDRVLARLQVDDGFREALAAAFGRDLEYPARDDAPTRWTGLCAAVSPLPDDPEVVRLDEAVHGADEILPKLMSIGVVETREQALAYAGRLEPGITIVSKDGAAVRWDGLVSETPPGGAAERVVAEARRRELETLRPEAEATRDGLRALVEAHGAQAGSAKLREEDCRRHVAASQDAERAARLRRDAGARANAENEARAGAISEQIAALEQEQSTATAAFAEAERALADAPDTEEVKRSLDARRAELTQVRREAEAARVELDGVQRMQRERRDRIAALTREEAELHRRIAGTDERRTDLERRIAQAVADIVRFEEAPEAAALAAAEALREIDQARVQLAQVAAALEGAEREAVQTEIAQRDAELLVGGLREERSRLVAGIGSAQEIRFEVERQIQERTGAEKDALFAVAQIEPGADLPAAEACEARHNKLMRERETLGNVNLLAEEHLATALGDSEKLVVERNELRQAVEKLREQIGEIDREAQTRIEAAFVQVDEKFRFLFTRLFGGGHAQLKLIGGETPLSSGLEIFAAPPGKKMQSLQLMSGGEQALTALSLVFAAFLVSPSPICVLDEVDAPLDDANVDRLCSLMEDLSKEDATRFVVVTHHAMTMSRMDRLYGVTMAERGVSRVASVNLKQATDIVAQDEILVRAGAA